MAVEEPEWLEHMEGILETLNEGVLILDDRWRIVFVNECMERLLGVSRSAVIGKTAEAFYSGEDLEFLQRQRVRARQHGRNRYEFYIPRADGTRVPVIVSGRELENPDGLKFVVDTFSDITDQKKAEESLREANAQLEKRAAEMRRDLSLAARVQQSLAPRTLEWGRLAVETFYKPVLSIGGDFGVVSPHANGYLDLLICDVSGHGISSALLASRIYAETVSLLRGGSHPGSLLHLLNQFVVDQIGISGFMFTMAAARLDQSGNRLTYAAGGHPPAFWLSPSGELRRLEARATILGALENAVPGEAADSYELSRGDRLMIYSDGLTEVWDAREEMLGVEGLQELARSVARRPLAAMRDSIIRNVVSYSATPVLDDMSLILLEVR